MVVTAAAITTMIVTQVKSAILDEITREKKPNYVELIAKLDKKLDKIIMTVNDVQKKQYKQEVRDRYREFAEVKDRIVDMVQKLPKDEPYSKEDQDFYSLEAINLEKGDSKLTELKFKLLGERSGQTSIDESKCLPIVYRDYLILHKNGNSGIAILDFTGATLSLMRSAFEAIIAMKMLYTGACRISNRPVLKRTITEIETMADSLVTRMITGREKTFEVYYNLFKKKTTIKCNLQLVNNNNALDACEGKTSMYKDSARITETNFITPSIALGGEVSYDPPVYLIGPPDAGNPHMTWHLTPRENDFHFYIKHKEGIRALGWYNYHFYSRGGPASHLGPNDPSFLVAGHVVSIEDLEVVRQRGIEGDALWNIVLTGADDKFHFQNNANSAVLCVNPGMDKGGVTHKNPQIHVNHPTDIHENVRHWMIHYL